MCLGFMVCVGGATIWDPAGTVADGHMPCQPMVDLLDHQQVSDLAFGVTVVDV
jgi:hypothetical protein